VIRLCTIHICGGGRVLAYIILGKNMEERAPERQRIRWKGKIKIDVEDIASDNLDRIQLAQECPHRRN
jgi:hypothetical protein